MPGKLPPGGRGGSLVFNVLYNGISFLKSNQSPYFYKKVQAIIWFLRVYSYFAIHIPWKNKSL
jgi:hypothetical protein